jgi:hypothetical protein
MSEIVIPAVVAALAIGVTRVITGASYENKATPVEIFENTSAATFRPKPLPELGRRHLAAVEEVQPEVPHCVMPTRTVNDGSTEAKLKPTRVTCTSPEPAALGMPRAVIDGESYENCWKLVPINPCTESAML